MCKTSVAAGHVDQACVSAHESGIVSILRRPDLEPHSSSSQARSGKLPYVSDRPTFHYDREGLLTTCRLCHEHETNLSRQHHEISTEYSRQNNRGGQGSFGLHYRITAPKINEGPGKSTSNPRLLNKLIPKQRHTIYLRCRVSPLS